MSYELLPPKRLLAEMSADHRVGLTVQPLLALDKILPRRGRHIIGGSQNQIDRGMDLRPNTRMGEKPVAPCRDA